MLVWLDGIYYKVRHEGKVVTRVLYSVVGLTLSDCKQVLGIYTAESESARFWLTVLTDLKQRGVEDLLISCVDGLKGFDTAIGNVFPRTTVQLCVVHQLRNSFRFTPDKYLKDFVKDIKTVYQAPTAEQGWENLMIVQAHWGSRYPQAVQSWMSNWALLSAFFDYPASVRKVIYTTNTVEGYHGTGRPASAAKSDQNERGFQLGCGLAKTSISGYLVIQNLHTKWTADAVGNKNLQLEGSNELTLIFDERIKPHRFD